MPLEVPECYGARGLGVFQGAQGSKARANGQETSRQSFVYN